MKSTYRAIILRLPDNLIERIDSVVHDTGTKSRAEYLRGALSLQVQFDESIARGRGL
jgi:metal-responsive CopG/Arc/MetJ family transcriptional regulator